VRWDHWSWQAPARGVLNLGIAFGAGGGVRYEQAGGNTFVYANVDVRVIEAVVVGLLTCIAALAVHRARNVVRAHAAAEAERTRIQGIFGRYVPAQVAEQLIHSGHLAPQQREASIIFADIKGFTGLSESMPPSRVIGMLNSFFGAATSIIDERGGIVVNHVAMR
jgi:adenylate cyclase